MSVRSSEPKSNLDKWAYVFNIVVIVVAIVSVWLVVFYMKGYQYYPYYRLPAILLLIVSIISVFFSANGFLFFLKVYGKLQKAIKFLVILSIIIVIIGIVVLIMGLNYDSITHRFNIIIMKLLVGMYLIYLGIALVIRSIMAREKKAKW